MLAASAAAACHQARSFLVVISNYGEAGFKPLKHVGVKLWDVSKGEEAARPLADFSHLSKFEAEEDITQVGLGRWCSRKEATFNSQTQWSIT